MFFKFCFFPNWYSGLIECTFHISTWKSSPEDWKPLILCPKKIQVFLDKKHFPEKSYKLSEVLTTLPIFPCQNPSNFSFNVGRSLRKKRFSKIFYCIHRRQLWEPGREIFVERQKTFCSMFEKKFKNVRNFRRIGFQFLLPSFSMLLRRFQTVHMNT